MATPMLVGILNDMSDGPPAPLDMERWLRLCADDLIQNGRLDRGVDFVHAWGTGLPSGTAAAVERAYAQLADQGVLMIIGPAIGDNALVATPLAERYRVPTIQWAGAERARNDYMFHLQVGSHEDESIVLARYIASLGAQNVGVIYDRSPIGSRHFQFLQEEADILGLRISETSVIAPLASAAPADFGRMLDRIDALVYLGLGLSAPAVANAVREKDWSGPRAMNTAGLRGYDPSFGRIIDGWVYVDMHSDKNETLTSVYERVGRGGGKIHTAMGYDLGRLMAEGLARAPERTREGVRHGLEQIKYLPAAEGHEGTLLGFGPYDRGALHGRYLVLRQWRQGQTVEI